MLPPCLVSLIVLRSRQYKKHVSAADATLLGLNCIRSCKHTRHLGACRSLFPFTHITFTITHTQVYLWLDYSVVDQDNPMPGVQVRARLPAQLQTQQIFAACQGHLPDVVRCVEGLRLVESICDCPSQMWLRLRAALVAGCRRSRSTSPAVTSSCTCTTTSTGSARGASQSRCGFAEACVRDIHTCRAFR